MRHILRQSGRWAKHKVDESMVEAILAIADDTFDSPAYDELAKEVVPILIEKYK